MSKGKLDKDSVTISLFNSCKNVAIYYGISKGKLDNESVIIYDVWL